MCSEEDDPTTHDRPIPDIISFADTAPGALESVFGEAVLLDAGMGDMPGPEYWRERVEDLEALGYVMVPLSGGLTDGELVVIHDHLVRTLARR